METENILAFISTTFAYPCVYFVLIMIHPVAVFLSFSFSLPFLLPSVSYFLFYNTAELSTQFY